MCKQGLQAREKWWKNSNRSRRKKQNKSEAETSIEKDGFKTGISLNWTKLWSSARYALHSELSR